MITFIRHADKEGEDFTSPLSKNGRERAKWCEAPKGDIILCSTMPRAIETASILYPKRKRHEIALLNEFNKHEESKEEFINRVYHALDFLKAYGNCVVVSHGRFMCVAYQILTKQMVVGFDYLESFTV